VYLLCHSNELSPTILCALVKTTGRFHQLVDFAYLQISSTCRFHVFVDFTYLQISSICTCFFDWCCFHYSIRNSLVALLEPLFARMLWSALSVFAYSSFRPTGDHDWSPCWFLSNRQHYLSWPTVSFHLLSRCHSHQISLTILYALILTTSFHLFVDFTYLQIFRGLDCFMNRTIQFWILLFFDPQEHPDRLENDKQWWTTVLFKGPCWWLWVFTA